MPIVIDMAAGNPKLTSSVIHPTTWAFTAFVEYKSLRLGGTGIGLFRAENGSTERVEVRMANTGAVTLQKRDSLSASATLTLFTDADLATNPGRLKIALVSDGTNMWAIYQRAGGELIRSTNQALGTMSAGAATIAYGGIFAAGSFDGKGIFYGSLVYNAALTDQEVYAQVTAGLSPSVRPLRTESLIGWFPMRSSVSAMVNLAGLNDLTVTGSMQDTAASNDDMGSPWLDRYLVRYQNIATAPATTSNPMFFGAGV